MPPDNREIVREFFDAITRVDVAKLDEFYAEDFELWTAGTLPFSGTKNKAEALEGMAMVGAAFPDGLEFTISAMTCEGGSGPRIASRRSAPMSSSNTAKGTSPSTPWSSGRTQCG